MIGTTSKHSNDLNIPYKEKITSIYEFNRLPLEYKKEILTFLNINEKDMNRFLFKEEHANEVKLRNQLKTSLKNLISTKNTPDTITCEDVINTLPLTPEQKQIIITTFNLHNPPKPVNLPENITNTIENLLTSKYGIPLIITALPPYSKLKLKEQKELLQKLGLLELSDSVLYSTHPLTSVKKVEMRLLTTLTHYDLYII
jgi:hypothetical protein